MLWNRFLLTIITASSYGIGASSLCNSSSKASPNVDPMAMATYHHPRNTTIQPLNFLGVECYHLLPETVTLLTCQPLFARLVEGGDVYEKLHLWNGWICKASHESCVIKIESPARQDRRKRVSISLAQIIRYATEVLETCRETQTGGANVFEGSWRVVVTRDVLPRVSVTDDSLLDG